MSNYIKRRQVLGIALEETAGTPVVPQHFIEFLECSLAEKLSVIADDQARGSRFAEGPNPVEGKKIGEGKIDLVLDPLVAPYFFALALGSIVSEPESNDFVHTCKLTGNNEPLSATIWRDRKVDQRQFSNSVVDKWSLSFSDDVAKLSMDLKSKYPTDQARTASAVSALQLYTFRNATVKIGGSTFKMLELKLEGENGIEAVYASGSNDVYKFVAKEAKISGSFKLLFENSDQREVFEGLTKQDMEITFAGSGDDEIVITIPRFRIENWAEDGGLGDVLNENIEFTVEESDESGEEEVITAVITNNVEEYMTPES